MNKWINKPWGGQPFSRREFVKLFASALSGTILTVSGRQRATRAETVEANGVRAADLLISGSAFQGGHSQGTKVSRAGLALSGSGPGSYTSPIMEAPIPFNTVVPAWLAELPEGTGLELQLRTGGSDGTWSEWYAIQRNEDWIRPEDEDVVGSMVAVPLEDVTHSRLQYWVRLTGTADAQPSLRELRFTCLDGTAGPTADELVARQQALNEDLAQQPAAAESYAKPFVISRAAWCTSGSCYYTAGLRYHPVSHLIVHHTVTSNTSADWAAVVRTIWYYHTFTRGWGDIGYNFLADRNGVLYEGHLGGDDVVGIHAGDANTGSMALSLIGTFSEANANPPGIQPPAAMLNAAANLLAWKAAQKGINVYDAGSLPYMSWGLPRLMGHRDVYGTTSCPGQQAFDLLPWLRDEVARRLGFQSPHIYVDEMSGAFTKSSANWYTGPYGCGFNGHSYYTFSTTNLLESANWGEWRLPIPQDGWYEVGCYAPYGNTGRGETRGARYRVTHANGVNEVVVDQQADLGLWVSLGDFYFLASQGGKVYLSDLTTSDSDRDVWFDALRLRPRFELPSVQVSPSQPAADAWSAQRQVTFSWTTNNPAAIGEMTLEVADNSAFNNLIVSRSLDPRATSVAHSFNQDYARLYWRIQLRTLQNVFIASQARAFGIDSTPPVSRAVQVMFIQQTGEYVVNIEGSDGGSGVVAYSLDYQAEGASGWTNLQSGQASAAVRFKPPNPQLTYWFRSQAIDAVGHVEPPHASGDISSANPIILENRAWLPTIGQR